MQRNVLAVLGATSLVVVMAAQPARPDFGGTWKMDPDRSESIVNGYEPAPVTLVARQTASDLIVETKRADGSETLIFRLDGSQTFHPGDVTTTSRWDGTAFVMKTARKISGWSVTFDEIWRLDPTGRELIVEKTLNVQHGYERSAKDPAYSTAKDVFVRVETR